MRQTEIDCRININIVKDKSLAECVLDFEVAGSQVTHSFIDLSCVVAVYN